MTATAADLSTVISSAYHAISDERRSLVAASRELPRESEALSGAIRSLSFALAQLGEVRGTEDER